MNEVSWYQPVPQTSLRFIENLGLQKDAKIIDIGGGDSFLPDFLLAEGYTDITVLDISEEAINRARQRLGIRADRLTGSLLMLLALLLKKSMIYGMTGQPFTF